MAPSEIWGQFIVTIVGTTKHATCKHCGFKQVANAFRMKKHIGEKCLAVPANIKFIYRSAATSGDPERNADDPPYAGTAQTATALVASSSSTHSAASTAATAVTRPAASSSDAPPAKRRSSGPLDTFVDRTGPQLKVGLDSAFSKAIYASGLPLSTFDTPYWAEFFSCMRPSYKLPTPYFLSGSLLDNEYNKCSALNSEKIANASSLALMTDSYTNTRGENVINVIVTTPAPVLYKQVFRGKERETGDYVGKLLLEVIREIGPDKFYLLVTDNASNMQSAWEVVSKEFSHITPVGCAAHCWNLLFKDLVEKVPAIDLQFNRAKKVVSYAKKRSNFLSILKEKQEERYGNKCTTLKLPAKTRWGGAVILIKSLLDNKVALKETVITEDLDVDSQIRRYILDSKFWDRSKLLYDLLSPLHACITLIEGNNALLSDVYFLQKKFTEAIMLTADKLNLSRSDKEVITELLEERKAYTIAPIHLAAYMLDPRFRGEGLLDEEVAEAISFISKLAKHQGLNEGDVIANLGQFRTCSGFFATPSVMESAERLHPSVWWLGVCSTQRLSKLAAGLLNMPPSAAEVERSWSAHGFVHNKSRNRLRNERVTKLVTVRAALQAAVSKTSEQPCLSRAQLENYFDNYSVGVSQRSAPADLGVAGSNGGGDGGAGADPGQAEADGEDDWSDDSEAGDSDWHWDPDLDSPDEGENVNGGDADARQGQDQVHTQPLPRTARAAARVTPTPQPNDPTPAPAPRRRSQRSTK